MTSKTLNSSPEALQELSRRITRFDTKPWPHILESGEPDIYQFIDVVQHITDGVIAGTYGQPPLVHPNDADELAATCHLSYRLRKAYPNLVSGPLLRDRQFWISKGGELQLNQNSFIEANENLKNKPDAKPFHTGLFTSTGFGSKYGMWQAYLNSNSGSSLFPKPWRVWSVKTDQSTTIYEINNAAAWVNLIRNYPIEKSGILYPNWSRIQKDFAAVHMTLDAIVAGQGLSFIVETAITAPFYWDVESTFWLKWCFDSTKLLETIP